MKRSTLFFTILLLLFTALLSLFFLQEKETAEYQVVRIADGDSFTVSKNGDEIEIRLFGIDAPERDQPYYRKAGMFTEKVLKNGTIQLEVLDRDRFGRTVAWVYVDSLNLNRALVSHGLAWHFTRYSRDTTLARLEQSARAARTGLWSEPAPVPPWEFRKRKRSQM